MHAGDGLVASFLSSANPRDWTWLDTNPTRSPNAWAFRFIARCAHTVIDNLSAIAALLALESHVRSPVTLARSALEAAATGCFIMDVGASAEERLRRIMNLWLEEVQEQWNRDRGGDSEPESARLLNELSDFAEHSGFEVQRSKVPTHRPPRIAGPGHSGAARQLVEDVLPGIGKEIWRSMSGVAHSRQATGFFAAEYSLPHTMKQWQRTQSTAWHAAPTILATREFFQQTENYFGWEFDHWSSLFDGLVSCFMSGGGLHDDEIRKKLGLQRPT